MKLVYVAGPLSGANSWATEQNVRQAESAGLLVAQMGAAPIMPHANTRFFGGTCTEEFWYVAYEAVLSRCDAVLLLPRWQQSTGSCREEAVAREKGIPIFDVVADGFAKLREWLNIPACEECGAPTPFCDCLGF